MTQQLDLLAPPVVRRPQRIHAHSRKSYREQWRDIPGYEGWYQVSDHGRVRRVKSPWGGGKYRMLKASTPRGYPWVSLSKQNVIDSFHVHRLVMLAFVGPSSGRHVNHIDGVKTNNRLSNLEYVTPAENVWHAYAINLMDSTGEANPAAVLTSAQVTDMRRRYLAGATIPELASEAEISRTQCYDIIKGRSWYEQDEPLIAQCVVEHAHRPAIGTLSLENVALVRVLLRAGMRPAHIAKRIGITPTGVAAIRDGKNHAKTDTARIEAELVDAGLLREVGEKQCPVTGKTVRVVDINRDERRGP